MNVKAIFSIAKVVSQIVGAIKHKRCQFKNECPYFNAVGFRTSECIPCKRKQLSKRKNVTIV